jgi:hypothetical protein
MQLTNLERPILPQGEPEPTRHLNLADRAACGRPAGGMDARER